MAQVAIHIEARIMGPSKDLKLSLFNPKREAGACKTGECRNLCGCLDVNKDRVLVVLENIYIFIYIFNKNAV